MSPNKVSNSPGIKRAIFSSATIIKMSYVKRLTVILQLTSPSAFIIIVMNCVKPFRSIGLIIMLLSNSYA